MSNTDDYDLGALSFKQFCALYGISLSHLYALLQEGSGPRTMKVGGRRLVSRTAARDWQVQLESVSAPAA